MEDSAKRAFVTGITGQDGSYLAEILLEQKYEVHGLIRRSSTGNTKNIEHLLDKIELHRGDITDFGSVCQAIYDAQPTVVYHEADQDNVDWSFPAPAQSIDVTVKGTYHLLEAVKCTVRDAKVFIPCSAMMFGDAPAPQTENTPFNPQSPYAVAKASVYHLARYYRQVMEMYVTVGILYNHDSPRRHGDYLLHRICRAAAAKKSVKLWGLDSKVSIGYAKDFMEVVVKCMGLNNPDDFIIDGGATYAIRDLAAMAFAVKSLDWRGYVPSDILDEESERPGKPQSLIGDMSKLLRRVPSASMKKPITPLIIQLVEKYERELR
jgi:GDPmannose 4,6-dehydratase